MNRIKRALFFWKKVFGNWRYSLLALFIAFLFYSLNVLIGNFRSVISYYSSFGFLGTIKFFFVLAKGFVHVIPSTSVASLILISFLFGILFSLVLYRFKLANVNNKRNLGFFATMGAFLGTVAPGCAACGIGLLPLLGLSSAVLTFFPLKGLELSLLAIAILMTAIFKISEDSCKIMFKEKNERRLRWKEKI